MRWTCSSICLRHIGQHLLLKLRPHPVAAHQLLDIGQAQGGVEEVETALLEAVQDVFDFGQARREFALQFLLVGADHRFQGGDGFPDLPSDPRPGPGRFLRPGLTRCSATPSGLLNLSWSRVESSSVAVMYCSRSSRRLAARSWRLCSASVSDQARLARRADTRKEFGRGPQNRCGVLEHEILHFAQAPLHRR